MSSYDLLIQKLDQFTRKYYFNKLIRGFLFSVALLLALFILFSVLEYNFYFGTGVRKVFFFSFIGISVAAISYWVLLPIMRYLGLGKVISHEQAAGIIGDHFGDVKDKLLNVLQLKSQSTNSSQNDLIEASIQQKTEGIKLVPFKKAIDLSVNKKYLKFALPPFLLLIVLLFAAPSMIKDSTHRIINNGKHFEREAPFNFLVGEENPEVIQFEDYQLEVTTEGSIVPQEIFIEIDNFQYRLNKNENNSFSYTFKNLQKNTKYKLFSGFVKSSNREITVIEKPNLLDFSLALDYPGYTGRKDELLQNIGDVVVPQGTKISWMFNAGNTDDVTMQFSRSKDPLVAQRKNDQTFSATKRIMRDDLYKVYISNAKVPKGDSISYSINAEIDQYPSISVEKYVDSLETAVEYFIGNASDDYGLKNLHFQYTIVKGDGSPTISKQIPIATKKGRASQYDYTLDILALDLKPGDKLSYFFEVFDNDAVNGSKSAKTSVMVFEKPTIEEFKEKEDENEEDIKKDLEEAMKESKEIREEVKKMREKVLQKKELDWQDKKEMEKLLDKQKQLEEKLDQAKEKFQENMKNQEEFSPPNEELLKKQEKLQEMFEQLDPETQELMKKIEDLMEELNKDEMMEAMEDFEMDDEEMEKELDRLLELFKQLELEKELEEQIDKLEELAEEQEELSEETEGEEKSQEELEKEQEEINEEFEDIKEKLEELEKKNEELEFPKDLGEDKEEQMEEIQEELDDSQEQLEKKENSGAAKSQKKAAEKMKQMAGNLMESMQSGEQEQMEEDMAALRQLLENLINLSFDQEDLVNDIKKTTINTPRYVELAQVQFKLKDDFELVEDSLQALSKRVEQIETFVIEKTSEIKVDMAESLKELEDRKVAAAEAYQRSTMKNVNDLALMLDEAMQEMQQQMSSSMPGSQMCNKPGGSGSGQGKGKGKQPKDKMSKGQEGLNETLKKMQGDMKKNGKGGMSKQFAQAAQRQAAMRKALEEMQKGKQEQGKGSKELQEIIDQMNKTEEDLVNKRLDSKLLERQAEIETRLLEAEQAERQREKENKRKAETAEEIKREMPPALKEYLKKKEAEVEMYRTVSPDLKPYYKNLVKEYYKALKSTK